MTRGDLLFRSEDLRTLISRFETKIKEEVD